MKETPFFFPVDDQELFGVLHQPQGDGDGLGFVFCHPFAEEKLWAHRVYVTLARDLAARGHTVLRFDHMGHGDSDGEFEDASVETYLRDIGLAIRRLQAGCPGLKTLALMGLRLGATFAALAALRIPGIDRLILWDPVVDGARYMQEVLRSNLAGQLAAYGRVTQDRKALVDALNEGQAINVDGYELGRGLYDQVSAIDLIADAANFKGSVLIAQVGKPGQPARRDLRALAEQYPLVQLEVVAEEPFWREIKPFYARAEQLSAATMRWLDDSAGIPEQTHG